MNAHFFRVDYSSGLTGFALFTMANNELRGTDVGGLTYRGTYVQNGNIIEATVNMNIPAGARLVTGVCPQPMSFDFPVRFDIQQRNHQVLNLPTGQVRIAITPLP